MRDMFCGGGSLSNLTASAGTIITGVIPPHDNRRYITRILQLIYVSGATAHTLTVMKALGKSTLSAAASAGATSVVVNSASFGAGQTMAASDFAVIRLATATGFKYQLLAVSAISTLTLTVTALETAAPLGAEIWYFGTASETGGNQTILAPTASARTIYGPTDGGVATAGYKYESSDVFYQRSGRGDPMIVHSGNGTNAGTIELCSYGHFAA